MRLDAQALAGLARIDQLLLLIDSTSLWDPSDMRGVIPEGLPVLRRDSDSAAPYWSPIIAFRSGIDLVTH